MGLPGAASARRLLWMAALSPLVPNRRRARLLRRLGQRGIGDTFVCAGVTFSGRDSPTCGSGCFVNGQVHFDGGPIEMGRNVYIGQRAMILTGTHRIGGPDRRAGEPVHRGVRIGEGTWIGAGAIVLPGVTVGEGCVIGAGAVVIGDCDAHGLYAGVPARRIRDLADEAR